MKKTKIVKFVSIIASVVMILGLLPNILVSAAYENTHKNTGNYAYDIVEVAKTQIGYRETGTNDTKYNRWFGSLPNYGYNYAWCQTFVAWCANQAGVPTSMIPRVSGTISAKDTFKKNGTYHAGPYEGGSYTPKKGDIIYFYSSGSESKHHVGIVSDCVNGIVYTIEGNSSNQVATLQYSVNNGNIRGYGVPFKDVPNHKPDAPILSINQKTGTPDDTITISWGAAAYADSYWLHVYKDGEDYINQTLNQELSYSAKYSGGNYTAYVVSCNSQGETLSSVDFTIYDSNPESPYPQISKNLYSADEIVEVTWNDTANTTHYWLHTYKDGEEFENTDMYNNLSYSRTYLAGKYTLFIASYNNYGESHNYVEFTVYDSVPKSPELKIEKEVYSSDETISVSWNNTDNTTHYWLHTYKYGEEFENADMYNNLSYSRTYPAGEYTLFIASYNNYGESHECIKFTVYEKGDCNNDGLFSVSDVVLLQKWLLATPDVELANWKAADLCEDGRLNVFDLCLMKRMLIENS